MFSTSDNPLLARQQNRRLRGIALCAASLALLAAGTFAVSAKNGAESQPVAENAGMQLALKLAKAEPEAKAAAPRRQVRIIPLFNTPADPTGFSRRQ